MLVKQRLRINAIVTAVSAVAILAVLLMTTHRVLNAVEANNIADAIITTAFERLALRTDYMRTGSERAREQISAKYKQISDMLKEASEKFTDPEDKKTVAALIEGNESIAKIFRTVVANRKDAGLKVRSGALSLEVENRLISQLNMRVYETVLLGGKLQESSSAALVYSLKLAGGGIVFVFMLTGVVTFINSATMSRAISDRIAKLRDGAVSIGEGNLDHRIDIKGDDEFAELSHAFNTMTLKLQKSYHDLENEVIERKNAEDALRRTHDELELRVRERTKELAETTESSIRERRRFFDVLETLPTYVVLLTPDYRISFANRVFRERFGEAGGKRCYECLFNRTEPCEICETYTVLETNAPHHWYWTGPDSRDYDVYDYPFVDSDGSTLILEMGIDITEQKGAREALRQINETLEHRIVERTAELLAANQSLGASRMAALNLMEDAVAARQQAEKVSIDLLREADERTRAEDEIKRRSAILSGINTIFREALNLKTIEELAESCLRVALDITGSKFGFIGEIGPDGLLHDIAISDMGWELCTMYDKTGHRRSPGNFNLHGLYGKVLLDGKGFFTNAPSAHPESIGTPDGHPKLSAFSGAPLLLGGRTVGMIAVGNRVEGYRREELESLETLSPAIVEALHLVRAETSLRESEAHLNRSQEIAHLGSWELDLISNHLTWSDEVYRIFGLQPREFAATYEAFLERIHPDDRAAVDTAYSGSLLEGRDTYEIEHRVIRKSDCEIRIVLERCEHYRDTSGRAIRSVGMVHDITELKQAEEALKQSNAKLAEVNRELESFVYSASHDLRAPLRHISTFADLVTKHYGERFDEKGRDYLIRICKSASKMTGIIDDLLRLSRVSRHEIRLKSVDLSEMASSIVADLRESDPGRKVDVSIRKGLMVYADPGLMEITLSNLLVNAWKFTSKSEHSLIEVGAELQDGKTVYYIRDNGAGFDMKFAEKMFWPFHRLHPASEFEGTGIGLAIVERVIRRHGGKVWAEGETGKGATIYFRM